MVGTRDRFHRSAPLAPDLQGMVAAFGGYDRITPQAWATFDALMARYREYLRFGWRGDNGRE